MKHGEAKKPTLRRPLGMARGAAPLSFPSRKSEGDGALDGAGAIDGRARWPASRPSRSPEIRPEITGPPLTGDRRAFRRSIAASSLLHRAALSDSGAKRARHPSASSWQGTVV